MKELNDKFSDCVLTDEDLEKVSGGASTSGKRTLLVCPLCHDEGTYGSINEAFSDFMAHFQHLKNLGLCDEYNITNYIISVWDAAAPAAVVLDEE